MIPTSAFLIPCGDCNDHGGSTGEQRFIVWNYKGKGDALDRCNYTYQGLNGDALVEAIIEV